MSDPLMKNAMRQPWLLSSVKEYKNSRRIL